MASLSTLNTQHPGLALELKSRTVRVGKDLKAHLDPSPAMGRESFCSWFHVL